MGDILIRNVPDEVLASLDAKARQHGLSRAELVRRALERESNVGTGTVTVDLLSRVVRLAVDLDDDEVMRDAWS